MPIEIYWLVENKASYFKYIGDVTVEEFREANELGIAMFEAVDEITALAHSVQDGGQMTSFPRNLMEVSRISKPARRHPKMGWVVTVMLVDPFTRFIADMIGQLSGSRSRDFPSLTEALQFLNYVDSTLPDLSAIDFNQLVLYDRVDHSE